MDAIGGCMMARTKNETVPTQFRLKADTLADLDLIAVALSRDTGIEHSRTDAVRAAARDMAKKLSRKSKDSA